MPSHSPRLGKVQLQIMRLLWQHGKATARQITDELARTQDIAHSTVQTLLRKMEAKGAVTHDQEDRTFVYRPLYRQSDVTETALRDLLTRLFDGSVYGMVAHLLKNETVSPEELQRLRTLIDAEDSAAMTSGETSGKESVTGSATESSVEGAGKEGERR